MGIEQLWEMRFRKTSRTLVIVWTIIYLIGIPLYIYYNGFSWLVMRVPSASLLYLGVKFSLLFLFPLSGSVCLLLTWFYYQKGRYRRAARISFIPILIFILSLFGSMGLDFFSRQLVPS